MATRIALTAKLLVNMIQEDAWKVCIASSSMVILFFQMPVVMKETLT
jgi:hypothetical protein